VPRQAESFFRGRFVDAADLVENATGLHVGRPLFDATFAATHADFERLLRHRTVREDSDPQFSGALHVALNRHTSGFDLARGDAAGLEALHREIAEVNVVTALRLAAVVALLHLSVLGSFRGKHVLAHAF